MKSFSKFLSVVIVMGLSIFLLYTFYILQLKSSRLLNCQEELHLYKQIEARWREDFNKIINTNGNMIPDVKLIDQYNNEIQLSSIVVDKALIYRFSEVSCKPCVENDIKMINQMKDSLIEVNLCILTDFKTPKEMRIFASMFNLKVPIYSYSNRLNILADRDSFERKPYYFVADTSLKIHFTYISHSEHNMHEKYFARIIEYFK